MILAFLLALADLTGFYASAEEVAAQSTEADGKFAFLLIWRGIGSRRRDLDQRR